MHLRPAQSAFSLVELSIVLVILGLLTGGILGGQALIRAAELRSVGSQISGYQTAINTFRDKYFSIPGDITQATRFWGDRAAGAYSCSDASTQDGTPGTCNGDGDGFIIWRLTSPAESHLAWQHMALAGLIEGAYSGFPNATAPYEMAGSNVPRARFGNAGFTMAFVGTNASGVYFDDGGANDWGTATHGNSFFVGSNFGDAFRGALFRPEEGWNIDTKYDDGRPASGGIISQRFLSSCHTSNVATSAEYALAVSVVNCALRARML